MFERFTEKARRTIFFARYDASQYGSATIETEHLLLGLLREDAALAAVAIKNRTFGELIREEIGRRVPRHERTSTSVEVPLSKESKLALDRAAEEAEKLGHSHIDTGHLLLGLLSVEKGMAAQVLLGHGITAETIRPEIAKDYQPTPKVPVSDRLPVFPRQILEELVTVLKAGLRDKLMLFFCDETLFIDEFGNRWQGSETLLNNFDVVFAPYSARKAKFLFEDHLQCGEGAWIATLLWEDVPLPDKFLKNHLRMSVVMGKRGEELLVTLIQVTPVVRH